LRSSRLRGWVRSAETIQSDKLFSLFGAPKTDAAAASCAPAASDPASRWMASSSASVASTDLRRRSS
jgi:hypothetical protein